MLLFAHGVKQKTVVGNSFKGSCIVLKPVVLRTNLVKTSFENQTKGHKNYKPQFAFLDELCDFREGLENRNYLFSRLLASLKFYDLS